MIFEVLDSVLFLLKSEPSSIDPTSLAVPVQRRGVPCTENFCFQFVEGQFDRFFFIPELCTAMSPPLRGDRDEPFGDPENMG